MAQKNLFLLLNDDTKLLTEQDTGLIIGRLTFVTLTLTLRERSLVLNARGRTVRLTVLEMIFED